MAYILDEKIREVRDRIRLEDLVRNYNVLLQPAGRRLRALCPFHGEKTPSFYVDAEKQVYHCFGCKAAGDVFTFVRQMEKVDFNDAVGLLARQAGVILEYAAPGGGRYNPGNRTAIYEALSCAEEFYHRLLMSDPRGQVARDYLNRRSLRPVMWEKFRLGYSLPEWDGFLRHALAKGVSREGLLAAGLGRTADAAGSSSNRLYDYFRGRVMFPIADGQKRVIGFGARTLGDEQPKYLNSPKTAVFDKGQSLYGLPQARAAIEKEKRVAIVEGYTDAIMAHQEGLEFFAASLGTAFTADNARRLRRLAPRVDLVFDGDLAGQGAAERSISLLVAEDLEVRVYTVVNGKDPCDAILELGGAEFRRRLDAEAIGIFEFKWKRTVGALGAGDRGAGSTARALDEVLQLLMKVPNVVARKLYLQSFAEKLGIEPEDVEKRLKTLTGRAKPFDAAKRPWPQRSVEEKRGAVIPPPDQSAARPSIPGKAAENPSLEEIVLECLLADPAGAGQRWRELPAGFFQEPRLKPIAEAIGEQLQSSGLNLESLPRELRDPEVVPDLVRLLGRIEQSSLAGEGKDGPPATLEVEEVAALWFRCRKEIRRLELQKRLRELEGVKAKARSMGDVAASLAGEREYLQILKEMTRLRTMSCERDPMLERDF
ncbi:MAG: DNA primase [Planctomycetes bacterium]|nr:DNA primase [Planctomycetota bacterium]